PQGWLAQDKHLAAALLDQWNVSDELQRVPKTLFGHQEDRASVQRRAVPARLLERNLGKIVSLPAPLIFRQTLRPVAEQQQQQCPIVMGAHQARVQTLRFVKGSHGLVETPLLFVDRSQIDRGLGMVRLESQDLLKTANRLVEFVLLLENIAEIDPAP